MADPIISAHADPEGEAPWAMQIVVRVEKTDPPSRTNAAAATAVAVLALLGDTRCQPGGEWEPLVATWLDGRIRKHVRRARGAKWARAQVVPGVTVEYAGVQVRACVPGPTDQIPAELRSLQLSGLELDDPNRVERVDAPGLVISLCADPQLSFGKAAAAAGHAAQVAAMRVDPEVVTQWATSGISVEHLDADRWADALSTAPVVIHDAGFTEVDPGTVTATARWS